jgi:polar amino acid transport system substrate-binding protein
MSHSPATPGNTRSRAVVAAVAVSTVLGLAACGSSSGSGNPSVAAKTVASAPKVAAAIAQLPAAIRKRGSITVAMDVSSPPNHFKAKNGRTIVGIDPDIATALGQSLGLRVNIVSSTFDDIIPGMAAGKYDITISQMSVTADRMKVLDFVDYFSSGTALAVKKGNPLKITVDTMCGKTIAVLKGSFQEAVRLPGYSKACTAAGKPAIVAKSFPDQQTTVLALNSGHVQGVMEDSPVLQYALKQGAPIQIAGVAHVSPVAIGISKRSKLLGPIHLAMQKLVTSKQYKSVLDKWGVGGSGVTDARVDTIAD